ncbi:MAG: hypothetical protein AB2A00_09825 [Myxococcota bacterium]
MLTSAVTAALVAMLTWMGVEPGLYIAPLWVAVKVVVVASIGGLMWWRQKRVAARATPTLPESTEKESSS